MKVMFTIKTKIKNLLNVSIEFMEVIQNEKCSYELLGISVIANNSR